MLFTVLALLIMRSVPSSTDAPPLVINMDKYGSNHIVYNASASDPVARDYGRFYQSQVRV